MLLVTTPGYARWASALKHHLLVPVALGPPGEDELCAMAQLKEVSAKDLEERRELFGPLPRDLFDLNGTKLCEDIREEGAAKFASLLDSLGASVGADITAFTADLASTVMYLDTPDHAKPTVFKWTVNEQSRDIIVRKLMRTGAAWMDRILNGPGMWLIAPLRGHFWESRVSVQLACNGAFKRRAAPPAGPTTRSTQANPPTESEWFPLGKDAAPTAIEHYNDMMDIPHNSGRVQMPSKRNEAVLDLVLVGVGAAGGDAFVQVTTAQNKRVKKDNMAKVVDKYDCMRKLHDKARGQQRPGGDTHDYVLVVPPEGYAKATRPTLVIPCKASIGPQLWAVKPSNQPVATL
jgi:hypothetical protein